MTKTFIVGQVAETNGVVLAENGTGARTLTTGQPIYLNDTIYTGADSFITILDAQKQFHTLGEFLRLDIDGVASNEPTLDLIQQSLLDSSRLATFFSTAPEAKNDAEIDPTATPTDVIQDLENLPATAAGPSGFGHAAGAGEGSREIVWVDHILAQGAVDGTYPTIGINGITDALLDDVMVLPDDDPIALSSEITHDETHGVDADADDIDGIPDSVKSVLNQALNRPIDESSGFAQATLNFSFTEGETGQVILTPIVDGVDSGLTAVVHEQNASITLQNGGDNIIIGRVGDVDVFALYLESPSGELYLVQYHQINHPDTGNVDESVTLEGLEYTVLEEDGSNAHAELSIHFQDDGPTISSSESLIVDEGGLAKGSDNVGNIISIGNGQIDFGNDGVGDIKFNATTLGNLPDLSSNGEPLVYQLLEDNSILTAVANEVEIFRIEFEVIDGQHTGQYILKLHEPIDHIDEFNESINFSIDFTATDVDGDPVSGSFQVKILDDAPTANDDIDRVIEGDGQQTLGNVISGVDYDNPNNNLLQADSLSADRANSIDQIKHNGTTYQLNTTQTEIISDGNQTFGFDQTTGLLTIPTELGGQFSIYLFDSQLGDYHYTAPVSLTHEGCDDAISEQFEYQIKDFDLDRSQATLTIDVIDGEPHAGIEIKDVVKESGLQSGSDQGLDSEITMGGIPGFNLGPDGDQVSIHLNLINITDKNATDLEGHDTYPGILSSMGQDVSILTPASGLIIGEREDGAEVFRLQIETDGTYTFTLSEQLDHPEADQSGSNDIFDLQFQYTLDDHDGCAPTDNAQGLITITIEDDKPIAHDTNAGVLSEQHDHTGRMDSVDGVLNFKSGADDPAMVVDLFIGSVKDTDANTILEPLMSNGYEVAFTKDDSTGDIVLKGTVTVDGDVVDVMTVTVNKITGAYVIDLHKAIDHPDVGESSVDDQITVNFGYVVQDFDGDQQTSWLKVMINDDRAEARDDWDMVAEGGMTRGNVITGVDPDSEGSKKLLQEDWVGADAPGMIMNLSHNGVLYLFDSTTNTVSADQNVSYSYDAEQHVLTIQTELGGVFSITLQGPAVGWYKYTAPESTEHDSCDAAEFEAFRYGLKDFDGDIDYAVLDIAIVDGEPSAGDPVVATVAEHAIDADGSQPGLASERVFGTIQGFNAGEDRDALSIQLNLLNISDTNVVDQEGSNPYLGNIQSSGYDLIYNQTESGVIEAHRSGGDEALVFRLEVNAEGQYNFELFEAIDHPEAGENGSNDIFDLQFQYTLNDHDGCVPTASAQGLITITIEDDKPKAYDVNAGMLNERTLDTHAENALVGVLNFKSGADNPASVSDIHMKSVTDFDDGGEIYPLMSGGEIVIFETIDSGNSLQLIGHIEVDGETQDIVSVSIDKLTGSYQLTLHGPVDHPDMNEVGQSDQIKLKLGYTVTDFDGDQSTAWLNVTIKDDGPSIEDVCEMVQINEIPLPPIDEIRLYQENGLFKLNGDDKLTIRADFISEFASYSNTFGYYVADANGHPMLGQVIWSNSDNVVDPHFSHSLLPADLPAGASGLGFFLIPNGAQLNEIDQVDDVSFSFIDGKWAVVSEDQVLLGTDNPVYFSDVRLNPDQLDHELDSSLPGNSNWEDLIHLGDTDYNDLNLNIQVLKSPQACGYASGIVPVDFGADGEKSIALTGNVWINGQPSLTVDGEAVVFHSNADGSEILGLVAGEIAFILQFDSDSKSFEFWQFTEFDDSTIHDDIETVKIGFDVAAVDNDADSVLGKITIKAKVAIHEPPSGAEIISRSEDRYEDDASTPISQVTADETTASVEIKVALESPTTDTITKVILSGIPDGITIDNWFYDSTTKNWTYDNVDSPLFQSDQFSSVVLNLPEHWDNDLSIQVSAEIQNIHSQQTSLAIDAQPLIIVIDSVASQPDIINIQAVDASGNGEISGGENVQMAIDVKFHDISDNGDGAEQQYVLFKVPEGWSLANPSNVMIDTQLGFHAEAADNPPDAGEWYQVNVSDYLDQNSISDGSTITVKPVFTAPESLTSDIRYTFTDESPNHNSSGGELKQVWMQYTEGTGKLEVKVEISSHSEGFSLVVNDGPNPKGIQGELAVFYVDKNGGPNNQPVITVYEYSGLDNSTSYLNPGKLIASSLTDPSLFTISVTDDGNGVETIAFDFDSQVVSNYFSDPDNQADAEWTGVSFNEQVGIWLHPFGSNLETEYNNEGELVEWSGKNGWYDTNYQDTQTTCEPIKFEAIARSIDSPTDSDLTQANNLAEDAAVSNGLCVDETPCVVYRLANHPDGVKASPFYGLRLDGLFETGEKCDNITFNFEADGAAMFLAYDAAAEVLKIYGTAYGGDDDDKRSAPEGQPTDGDISGYDSELSNFWSIDFTYTGVKVIDNGGVQELIISKDGQGIGELKNLDSLETYTLSDKSNRDGLAFQLGDESGNGHRGFSGVSGWGWLMVSDLNGVTGDWLFTVDEPVDCMVENPDAYNDTIMVNSKTITIPFSALLENDQSHQGANLTLISVDKNSAVGGSIESINYQTHEIKFTLDDTADGSQSLTYMISDSQGGVATAQVVIQSGEIIDNKLLGSTGDDVLIADGESSLLGQAGNDVLVYEQNIDEYDGGVGNDTVLIVDSNLNLNFTQLENDTFQNIEQLDMRNLSSELQNNVITLNATDVLSMTSETNTLQILGDSQDTVKLNSGQENWQSNGETTIGSMTFAQFSQGNVTVQIQQEVNVDFS